VQLPCIAADGAAAAGRTFLDNSSQYMYACCVVDTATSLDSSCCLLAVFLTSRPLLLPQVCIYKGFCVKNGNFAIIMKLYSYSLAHRVSTAPGEDSGCHQPCLAHPQEAIVLHLPGSTHESWHPGTLCSCWEDAYQAGV
jgi:hypothetical protein